MGEVRVTAQRMGHASPPAHAVCECPPDIQGRHSLVCTQRRLQAERDENARLREGLEEVLRFTCHAYLRHVALKALGRESP